MRGSPGRAESCLQTCQREHKAVESALQSCQKNVESLGSETQGLRSQLAAQRPASSRRRTVSYRAWPSSRPVGRQPVAPTGRVSDRARPVAVKQQQCQRVGALPDQLLPSSAGPKVFVGGLAGQPKESPASQQRHRTARRPRRELKRQRRWFETRGGRDVEAQRMPGGWIFPTGQPAD